MPDRAFTFIDLFAGIGGMRLGFESASGECVFSSEWNRFSQITYETNFSGDGVMAGDITEVRVDDIPEHDVLLAGFPCQPFSLAGVSKKNSLGRAHGFADPTQGTLFFEIKRILKAHRPPAFLLENVKNLRSHDGGRTFAIIQDTLRDLGYDVFPHVMDGAQFVPQHRERIYLVGFRRDVQASFDWTTVGATRPRRSLRQVLHRVDSPAREPWLADDGDAYFDHELARVQSKYTLSPRLWNYLVQYADKHRRAGNGFGYGLVEDLNGVTRTLSARYYKDGAEILIAQAGDLPRRLTPRECARLMGYGDDFVIPVSDTQAYRQFGNSVVVPAIKAIAHSMIPHLGVGLDSGETGSLAV